MKTVPNEPIKSDPSKGHPGRQITDNINFRKLIENSYGGIILIDKLLNVIFRSHSAERITGWNTKSWGNKTIMENIHLADREKVWVVFSELAKSPGGSRGCIFRSEHADGHYVWLECVFTNFLTDPDIEAMLCNCRDITGKQHADEFLHQSLKELSDYKYALDESAIVSITDQKGIINYVNDSFCRISKYSREELIGQDHRIINSGYHDKSYIRNLWKTIATGKIWKGEFRNKAKDGSFYWVYATIVPFLNKRGKPYQYVSVRFDISIRKKIIIELEESEKKYSELFHLSPLPMWVINLDTLQFLDVNKATVTHYGHSREQFLSMTLKDIWPDDERDKLATYFKEDKQSLGETILRTAVHKKKNGDLINVEVQIARIKFNGILSNLVIATDVTERLKYIRAVEEQNKKLREISWLQSHVVRAPLARIMGLIPLLKDAKTNNMEREKILDFLNSSAVELDEIIKDITDKTVVEGDRTAP
ncbi:MAG TPA: PAS domain S-box protein [Mucilaginibacter sp.]|jgi:PAS domain S-box-containing protein|nr:PAS domain S-box protein [Mucilaginibacter sp.]